VLLLSGWRSCFVSPSRGCCFCLQDKLYSDASQAALWPAVP
jgi:hypothetical protein